MQTAAHGKAQNGQRQTADAQVEHTDREAVRMLGDGLVPRPGQRKDDRRDQHKGHALDAAAAVVAQRGDEHAAEAERATQRLARGQAVLIAVEEVRQNDAHKALGAVQDAAHSTGQQRDGGVVEEILRRGLPQAQPAGRGQRFAARHRQRAAVQRQTGQPDQRRAHHEADAREAQNRRGIGRFNSEQAVAQLDERKRRAPQHIADNGHQDRCRRDGKELVEFRFLHDSP